MNMKRLRSLSIDDRFYVKRTEGAMFRKIPRCKTLKGKEVNALRISGSNNQFGKLVWIAASTEVIPYDGPDLGALFRDYN